MGYILESEKMIEDTTADRIHLRIDETHKLINEVKIDYATQRKVMENLDEDIKTFIKKVDDSIFHIENGHIVKTKTKLSAICVQLKNQWYIITLLFAGILGVVWMGLGNK